MRAIAADVHAIAVGCARPRQSGGLAAMSGNHPEAAIKICELSHGTLWQVVSPNFGEDRQAKIAESIFHMGPGRSAKSAGDDVDVTNIPKGLAFSVMSRSGNQTVLSHHCFGGRKRHDVVAAADR